MKTQVPSAFANGLLSSAEEALAHSRGKKKLRAVRLELPAAPKTFEARRIVRLRKHLKMTQQQIAEVLNVSSKTIEGWEQGLRVPSGMAVRLLQILENPRVLQKMVGSAAQ
ncbi:MAG: helix-turn-helix domain-containing protein [Candidatus Sumerlaeaceae bacterium]|nr:helix-turn-helix domain-containing protein [Candidatus Sumerlaeaceae bacterium]